MDSACIDKGEYLSVQCLIMKALQEDFQYEEALSIAYEDWRRDFKDEPTVMATGGMETSIAYAHTRVHVSD